jgi:hypothetical protein
MSQDHECGDGIGAGRRAASALLAALLAGLAACHTGATRTAAPAPAPATAAQPADDPSYDWHGLLIVPLGSALKEVPLKLHEVLLFRDAAAGAAAPDDAECYAADSPAPRFLGRVPDQYLLCFRQDRLSRVQASVSLPTAEAPGVFAAACARWSNKEVAGAAEPGAAEPGDAACGGHEGAIHYSGRLDDEAVSMTIDGVSNP